MAVKSLQRYENVVQVTENFAQSQAEEARKNIQQCTNETVLCQQQMERVFKELEKIPENKIAAAAKLKELEGSYKSKYFVLGGIVGIILARL